MTKRIVGMWKIGLLVWLIVVLIAPVWAWAQAGEGAKAAIPEVKEEAPPEKKPEKPPEKKPPEMPGYIAGPKVPEQPGTTLEVGPTTGIMAPYGYSGGMDTLARGWQSPHRLGVVRFSPFMEIQQTFNSNIYSTTSDKKSDFITSFNPAMRLELPMAQRHLVSLGYLGNYYAYNRYDQNDHLDHTLNLDGSFNFPQGLALRGGSTIRYATEDRTATTGVQRTYERLSPYFQAAYKMADRWKIEANYQEDSLMFVDPVNQASDYNCHNAAVTLFYKFLPKTAAMAQYIYTYRQHPYSRLSNNVIQTPMLGLTFDPTAKISGTLKVGYTFQQFDFNMPGRTNSSGDASLSIQTLYRYSQYTNVTLVAQRAIQEDPDSNNNSYVNSGFFLTYNHLFHYLQIASYANVSYYNNRYLALQQDPVTGIFIHRTDNIISLGGGFTVPITKYFKGRLDYTYYNKGSDMSNVNYNVHKIMVGVQVSY
jgi:hypothetical protein